MGGTAPFTDAARVRALLQEWYDEGWSRRAIANSTGIDERIQYRIFTEAQTVGFDTLDRLLTGMDQCDRWYTDFADVYALVAPTSA